MENLSGLCESVVEFMLAPMYLFWMYQSFNYISNFHVLYMSYRAVGATIVNRTEEIKDEDVGTDCGLFEIEKIGDEWVLLTDFSCII